MMTEGTLTLRPIGTIESCYKECFGTPRQGALAPASEATLRLAPGLSSQGFLSGLESFSHAWLVWHFHANESSALRGKVYPPRLEGEKTGVFATRSPHRPNPLGLTLVEILEVGESSLRVRGVDLIDGTPVFDIKPYLPDVDRAEGARGGWTEKVAKPAYAVRFSEAADATLGSSALPIPASQFRDLIAQSLALDPRPEGMKARKSRYFFRLFEWDIGFEWTEDGALVTEIRLYSGRKN